MQTELGDPTALMSVAKMKLLLQKWKSSSVNAPKPPAGTRTKSSGLNAPILRRLLSPRIGHPGAIRLSSPSMRGNGSLSLSAPPDSLGDTRIVTARELAQGLLSGKILSQFIREA